MTPTEARPNVRPGVRIRRASAAERAPAAGVPPAAASDAIRASERPRGGYPAPQSRGTTDGGRQQPSERPRAGYPRPQRARQ